MSRTQPTRRGGDGESTDAGTLLSRPDAAPSAVEPEGSDHTPDVPPSPSRPPFDPFRSHTFRPSVTLLERGWEELNRLQDEDVRAADSRRRRRARGDRLWLVGAAVALASVVGVLLGYRVHPSVRAPAAVEVSERGLALASVRPSVVTVVPVVAPASAQPTATAPSPPEVAPPVVASPAPAGSALRRPVSEATPRGGADGGRTVAAASGLATAVSSPQIPNSAPAAASAGVLFIQSRNLPE